MTTNNYIDDLRGDKKQSVIKLISIIREFLPKGYEECLNYGMPSWVVPHSIYKKGYHCSPDLPLPFLSLAARKNNIAIYHMGIYADKKILDWFVKEYPKHAKYKLDMGKSCIRFKKLDDIPYNLIAELCSKMTVKQWISLYEKALIK